MARNISVFFFVCRNFFKVILFVESIGSFLVEAFGNVCARIGFLGCRVGNVLKVKR